MQVDEDYNPSGDLSERAARKQYHQKLRLREAEELRLKYLGPQQANSQKNNDSQCHYGSRASIKAQVKRDQAEGRVTYVFQELDDQNKDG